MTRIPIRIRVATAFAVAMAIVFAGSGWFVYSSLASQLSDALNRDLMLRADDLEAIVSDADASLSTITPTRFVEKGESYAQVVDTHNRVVDATGKLHGGSLLTPAQLHRALRERFFADRPAIPGLDEPSRFLTSRVKLPSGHPGVLVVGATLENRVETLENLRAELLIAGPVALALASLAGYVLAGVSLRQVESMRRRAASISAETPGERLPVPHTRDELERLGETLNVMLERLESGLERERDFVADAGHELRTPLALLRTELELALRHARSGEELREAVRRSSAEVDRLTMLAEDLLLIARSHRGSLPLRLETVDAGELLASVASRFAWRAQEGSRAIRIAPQDGLRVHGDRLRLEQALGNLVDNALRHGSGDVELRAVAAGDHVELRVTDHGGGFPSEFLGHAFERFARADQVRTRGGSGLGLAIVRVIAEAHGGSAHVQNRDGGADAWVAVPEAAQDAPT